MKEKQKKQTEKTAREKETRTGHKTHITNIYKNIPTEERIKMYLKICRYVNYGEELK